MRFSAYYMPFLISLCVHAVMMIATPGNSFHGRPLRGEKLAVRVLAAPPVNTFKENVPVRVIDKKEDSKATSDGDADGIRQQVSIEPPVEDISHSTSNSLRDSKQADAPLLKGEAALPPGDKAESEASMKTKVQEPYVEEVASRAFPESMGIPNEERGAEKEGPVFVPSAIAFMPEPEYPDYSRRLGEEGVVLLAIEIDDRGRGVSISVIESSGYSRLDRAAIDALTRARFTPAERGGVPASTVKKIAVRFNLRDKH